MQNEQQGRGSKAALTWAILASLALLVAFGWMESAKVPVMQMKAQWLWIVLLPILIALVTGRYIGKIEAAGIKIEIPPETRQLAFVPPQSRSAEEPHAPSPDPSKSWTALQNTEYRRTNGLFLVHVYEPSATTGQKYDITIFLMRHVPGRVRNQKDNFSEVDKLELYFGPSWKDAIFDAPNNGGPIGRRVSAWGTFLAIGRVLFNNGQPPLILQRYIDFEMEPKRV